MTQNSTTQTAAPAANQATTSAPQPAAVQPVKGDAAEIGAAKVDEKK
jgi:hypothetical protein